MLTIPSKTRGQVVTFYSYKGGTGRSMALANVACLLARNARSGRGVLMVDWDLEAPGLHNYFRHFPGQLSVTRDEQRELSAHPGLIDLFCELEQRTREGHWTEENVGNLFDQLRLERFIQVTEVPSLFLLKAGAFNEGYATRVNTFQWEPFYQRTPWLIRAFAQYLSEQYQHVLIDSRTGLNDISGICTMLMPEKLVVVFTPNRQSVLGGLDLIRRAVAYRKQSEDLRPLAVFPLPSRIEAAEPKLRENWRYGNPETAIQGYQSSFESLFSELYQLPRCDLEDYFDEVQIQHMPRYAYGEEIAVLVERQTDRLSLVRSYESFVQRLVGLAAPWEPVAPQRPPGALPLPFQGAAAASDFDVFREFHRNDCAAVSRIVEGLRRHGIRDWRADEHARPGMPLMAAMLGAAQEAGAIAVFIGPEGLGLWQKSVLPGLLEQAQERNVPVIPVLLPSVEAIPEDAPELLRNLLAVRFSSLEDKAALSQLVWGITGQKPPVEDPV